VSFAHLTYQKIIYKSYLNKLVWWYRGVRVRIKQQVKVNGEVYLVTCHSGIQEGRGVAVPFCYPWCWIGWVVNTMPQPLYPTKEPWYPLYRRPVGPRDWSDGCGKSLPHWGSHLQASQYTDYATSAAHIKQ